MLETIQHWDEVILFAINNTHTPFWDKFMLFVSRKQTWYIFYAILLFCLYKTYPLKSVGIKVLIIVLLIAMADRFSSGFCKPFFKRYRPCYDVNLAPKLQVPEKAGSQYGFISSHAANSFAIAMIFGFWLKPRKYWLTGMLIWATLISYSRVYLAVHYTTDVLAGGITGVLFALICYKFAKVLEEKLILNQ